ncbi:MAG: flagellar biosynthesis anti-sigma factor FlgM [Pseudomonas sp.]
MKIDNSTPISRLPQPETGKADARPAGSATGAAPAGTVSHLSEAATDTSKDIDPARVAEIRRAISEGRLEIHPEKIADGLINSVRSLLGEKGE